MGDEHGWRWKPLDLSGTVALFRSAPVRWWISGGRALELHLGRSWRDHDDSDVSVLRRDVGALASILDGWEVQVAAAGRLRPWRGEALRAEAHENNLWCRPAGSTAWSLDVTLSAGDDDAWAFRRDPTVRLPWDEAVLHDADAIPYLAPELQLLFKSKAPRPKDDVDAEVVIPRLAADRAARLASLLPAGHPWLDLLP